MAMAKMKLWMAGCALYVLAVMLDVCGVFLIPLVYAFERLEDLCLKYAKEVHHREHHNKLRN